MSQTKVVPVDGDVLRWLLGECAHPETGEWFQHPEGGKQYWWRPWLRKAILAALSDPRLSRRDEWLPIENAPKDGTPILVWGGTFSLPMEWDDQPHNFVTLVTFENKRWVGDYADNGNQFLYQPTHWQPLPEPPKE